MFIESGEYVSDDIPEKIKAQMRDAGIDDPFVCKKYNEFLAEGM